MTATQPASRDLPIQPQPISNYSCGEVIFIAIATIVALAGILGIVSQHVTVLHVIRDWGFSANLAITLTIVGVIALSCFFMCRQNREVAPSSASAQPVAIKPTSPREAAPIVPASFHFEAPKGVDTFLLSELLQETPNDAMQALILDLTQFLQEKGLTLQQARERVEQYTQGSPYHFPIPKTLPKKLLFYFLEVLLLDDAALLSCTDYHIINRNRIIGDELNVGCELKDGGLYYAYVQLRLNLAQKPANPKKGTLGDFLAWGLDEMNQFKNPSLSCERAYFFSYRQIIAFLGALQIQDGRYLYLDDQNDLPLAYLYTSSNLALDRLRKEVIPTLSVPQINQFIKENIFKAHRWLTLEQLSSPAFNWAIVKNEDLDALLHLNKVGTHYTSRGRFDELPQSVQSDLMSRFLELNNMPPKEK